jgi:hypothetical protein
MKGPAVLAPSSRVAGFLAFILSPEHADFSAGGRCFAEPDDSPLSSMLSAAAFFLKSVF